MANFTNYALSLPDSADFWDMPLPDQNPNGVAWADSGPSVTVDWSSAMEQQAFENTEQEVQNIHFDLVGRSPLPFMEGPHTFFSPLQLSQPMYNINTVSAPLLPPAATELGAQSPFLSESQSDDVSFFPSFSPGALAPEPFIDEPYPRGWADLLSVDLTIPEVPQPQLLSPGPWQFAGQHSTSDLLPSPPTAFAGLEFEPPTAGNSVQVNALMEASKKVDVPPIWLRAPEYEGWLKENPSMATPIAQPPAPTLNLPQPPAPIMGITFPGIPNGGHLGFTSFSSAAPTASQVPIISLITPEQSPSNSPPALPPHPTLSVSNQPRPNSLAPPPSQVPAISSKNKAPQKRKSPVTESSVTKSSVTGSTQGKSHCTNGTESPAKKVKRNNKPTNNKPTKHPAIPELPVSDQLCQLGRQYLKRDHNILNPTWALNGSEYILNQKDSCVFAIGLLKVNLTDHEILQKFMNEGKTNSTGSAISLSISSLKSLKASKDHKVVPSGTFYLSANDIAYKDIQKLIREGSEKLKESGILKHRFNNSEGELGEEEEEVKVDIGKYQYLYMEHIFGIWTQKEYKAKLRAKTARLKEVSGGVCAHEKDQPVVIVLDD